MALSASILERIRDEIGTATDFTDDDLEAIYTDQRRGASNAIQTAIIVWKRRLADLSDRSFDAATAGTLVTRSQRVAYIERRIKELQFKLPAGDYSGRGSNKTVLTVIESEAEGAEF